MLHGLAISLASLPFSPAIPGDPGGPIGPVAPEICLYISVILSTKIRIKKSYHPFRSLHYGHDFHVHRPFRFDQGFHRHLLQKGNSEIPCNVRSGMLNE